MTKSEQDVVRRMIREDLISTLKDLADTGDMWDGTITSSMIRETISTLDQGADKSDDARTETADGE